MYFSMFIIKNAVLSLKKLAEKIKDSDTRLDDYKVKTYEQIINLKLGFNEYKYCTRNIYFNNVINRLDICMNTVKSCNNGVDMKTAIAMIIGDLDEIDYSQEDTINFVNYNMLDDKVIEKCTKAINNRNRKFNVFDCSCNNGLGFEAVKNATQYSICYGLEANPDVADEAKRYGDYIIKGVLTGSRISNNVFDFLINALPYNHTLERNMGVASLFKLEKDRLQSVYKYLNNEAVVLFEIPFFRMHKDICTHFARYYKNVQVMKSNDSDEINKGLMYIFGQKDSKKNFDQNIYNKLRRCCDYSKVPEINEINLDNLNLSPSKLEVDLFKGSMIDKTELLNIAQNSGCLDNFFEKQKVVKIAEANIKPLLPFNIGQIGLVLTSGCLDGVIDEGDGHYHLVKGRVAKTEELVTSVSNGEKIEQVTHSNKVEINVFLPNGDFKTLA